MPSRRRFLQQTLAATAAFGVVPAWARSGAAISARRPIVVIGAGLAGLATAERLSAAGEAVLVLEARAAPGGRVRTWRGFADGQIAEAGPTRIADVHQRCLALAGRLGLTLEPCEATSGEAILVHRGCRIGASEACDLADPGLELAADERGLTAGALLERYAGDFAARLGDPDAALAAAAFWQDIDRLSWPEWLAIRGASPTAISLMTLGANARELSALYVLRQMALHRPARAYFRIAGGMNRLPATLAARLGERVRYGVAVTRIEHDGGGARVHAVWDRHIFAEGVRDRHDLGTKFGGTKFGTGANSRDRDGVRDGVRDRHEFSVEARAVVVTLPPAALRSLALDPGLPAPQAHAIENVRAYPATRYAVQTQSRSWQRAGLCGAARTDAGVEIGEASFGQPGSHGLLHATAYDPVGASSAGSPSLLRGVDYAAEAFPGVTADFERGLALPWAREPLAGGAFAGFRPGQLAAMPSLLARPTKCLHFAGEHTSPWTGWMEGALDSAERVCRELLA
ncbi:MAG: FAD-dependent oxidoreductase [Gammaproteobacteria bacterium]|nr:FAD-dependent oxidoreductase [Gammaproteobacteria bacterium]